MVVDKMKELKDILLDRILQIGNLSNQFKINNEFMNEKLKQFSEIAFQQNAVAKKQKEIEKLNFERYTFFQIDNFS